MLLLLATLACSDPPPPPPPPAAPVEAQAPEEEPPPAGSIGGEPILDRVVVMGGIAAETIQAGIATHVPAIDACYSASLVQDPSLRGKVLVRFTLDAHGVVTGTRIRSSSLRHPPTETCVADVVASATFPPLASGDIAIVHYPFHFGLEEAP